jgi:crotonobetainyl-CoA:carnitine CoA-transferase CaiB-like acyl-CoA transferase
VRSAPPSIGEHSQALLLELGYTAADIEELQDAKVVAGG